jgi:hypothetical protein
MRSKGTFSVLACTIAMALLLFSGCAQPTAGEEESEEPTLTYQNLVDNLEILKQSELRSGRSVSVFKKHGNKPYLVAELGAYIDGIKTVLGGYVILRGETRLNPLIKRKVTYYSTDSQGNRTKLSGLVFIPVGLKGKLSVPIIAYQHGTQVYRSCEPSNFDPNPRSLLSNPELTGALQNYLECSMGALMATAGYIVVMCDYQGFGEDGGMHPYVHLSLGEAVRDIVVHTRTVIEKQDLSPRIRWNGQIFLIGYSEGGYATMAGAKAMQLKHDADPTSLQVTAAFPMAGSYDLSTTERMAFISRDPYPAPWFFPYALTAYDRIYTPVTHEFRSLMKGTYNSGEFTALFDGYHTTAEITALMPPTSVPADLLTAGAIELLSQRDSWIFDRLAENDAWRGWIPAFPLQMIHCPTDDIVPYENALKAYEGFGYAVLPPIPVEPLTMDGFDLDIHMRAYIPALLTGFTLIDTMF